MLQNLNKKIDDVLNSNTLNDIHSIKKIREYIELQEAYKEKQIQRSVAEDIINTAELICQSKEYFEYRYKYGFKGAVYLFLTTIINKYLSD